jgi:hypothetical protein
METEVSPYDIKTWPYEDLQNYLHLLVSSGTRTQVEISEIAAVEAELARRVPQGY